MQRGGRIYGTALALGLFAPAALAAQEPAALSPIRIEAEVEAAAVRFEREPAASLRFHGCDTAVTPQVVERRNLPERIVPGTTYRDVRLAVVIEVPVRLEARAAAELASALRGIAAAGECPRRERDDTQEEGSS